MPKYIIRDTTPYYVSWYYEIEADDEDSAYETFCDGPDAPATHVNIGESCDYGSQSTEVVDSIPITAIEEAVVAVFTPERC